MRPILCEEAQIKCHYFKHQCPCREAEEWQYEREYAAEIEAEDADGPRPVRDLADLRREDAAGDD